MAIVASSRQSPIDISTTTAMFDVALENTEFNFDYKPKDFTALCRDGEGWVITVGENSSSSFSASHLKGHWKLKEVRCHWGTSSHNGSEHRIDGEGFAGEIQTLHWNTVYDSYEEALAHPNGIAALAIFLRESPQTNCYLESVLCQIHHLNYKNDGYSLEDGFDLKGFLIAALGDPSSEFWTYDGSLTFKPYYECAVWTVFHSAAYVSARQMDILRSFEVATKEKTDDGRRSGSTSGNQKALDHGCCTRTVQPVNGRKVLASFHGGGRGPFSWDDASD